MHSKRV